MLHQPSQRPRAPYTILVINQANGEHTTTFVKALRESGHHVVILPLCDIAFDTRTSSGLSIPGIEERLPDAVFVRSVGGGSFEAVTRRLGILHAFDALSVPVWNSARAIERCVDKSMTSFLLQQAGLPTPATMAVEGPTEAQAAASLMLANGPLVSKPLFGAQGRGLRLVRSIDDLPPSEEVDDTYYLQSYIHRAGPPFRDYRVFVCAGRVVEMMMRESREWITNIQKGATPRTVPSAMREALSLLAVAATAAVSADFAGVDIVPDEEGRLQVVEVNSMPAWSGLQSVSKVNIAHVLAEELTLFLERSGSGVRDKADASLPTRQP